MTCHQLTTFLKLYERFAPEEVKNSKLETLALGGLIFQAIILRGLFGYFGGFRLGTLYMAETFVDPTRHLWGLDEVNRTFSRSSIYLPFILLNALRTQAHVIIRSLFAYFKVWESYGY
jgi:hypothetical protein